MRDGQPLERLQAIGAAFSSTVAGQVLVLTLLKRWRLVTTLLDPRTIEDGWEDSYPNLWRELAGHALGYEPKYVEATREELWKMARSLAAGIDLHTPRFDHYPDGWAGMMAVVRSGKAPPPLRTEPTAVSLPTPNPRLRVLDTVDYVASELGVEEEEVLRRIRRTRRTVVLADERALLALLEARAAGGGT